jgi:hypothetical protein
MRGISRSHRGGLVGAAACSVLACSALAIAAVPAGAVTAARATAGAVAAARPGSATVPVIVFLKKQPAGGTGGRVRSGERSALIQEAQVPFLSQLQRLDATDVRGYRLVDAIAARVPAAAVGQLATSPGVAAVIPDSPIIGPSLPAPGFAPAATTGSVPGKSARRLAAAARPQAKAAVTPAPGACSGTPQLEPEGLGLTRTDSTAAGAQTARSLGYTGAGVTVGFLGDGLDPANVNLMRNGKSVITDYRDFSGDGTSAATDGGEAFLDANAIAGQGRQVYNVAGFGAQVPGTDRCDVRIEGVAPGANVVALKVFSKDNVSTTSAFLQAIDYAVSTAHVNVLNESFGANPFPDVSSLDAVQEFNDMAVAAGVTVVVAAGDAGPSNTIGSPASDPRVISVGASTDFRFYAQTDYAGADRFAPRGWEDDNISSLSSGGFTQSGRTLDLVAPGDLSFASCTANTAKYASCVNFNGRPSAVEEAGGTSESAPEVAGAAALVIQAYRKANGGDTPSPAVVRQILSSTATDLGAPATEQGAGLLNSLKAVQLAAWMPHCDPVGETLRLSASQLNYVGAPGATASWSVRVTNTGAKAQTVAVSGRGFGPDSVIKNASVTLSDTRSPHFGNWAGVNSNYGTVTFTVPAGQAVLNSSIAWPAGASESGQLNKRVRLILVDPSGRLAAHSMPQGVSGYGSAQVLHPAAGRWTAVIFSDVAASGGTAGTVQFGASVERTRAFGTVSPSSLSLAPGATGTVHIAAIVPAGAGDSSGALVLDAGMPAGGAVTVPVTLRGTVTVGLGTGGTFSGALTGGNGRSPGEGQVASYQFTVPSSLPVLLRNIDADVTLANDPANQVSGYLIAPDGQTMGYGSSYLTTGFDKGVPVEAPQRQLSVYTSNPIPGVWTLIVDFTSPVPGNELTDPFSGRIRFNSVQFSRGALPDSATAKITRGTSVTYQVTVHNNGAAPEDVFLDARLPAEHAYQLAPQDQVSGLRLPMPGSQNPPEWIVPTMTHSVSVTATSTRPAMFDFGPFPGDPDVASRAGLSPAASYPPGRLSTPVTQGLWFAVPSQVGPYGAAGAATARASLTATAVTQEFDPAMSSPVGDFWQFGVSPLAATARYNLVVVNPGKSAVISLTVRPTGKAGTVVRGDLYIDDFVDSLQFLSGSQLVDLPYQYTIG